MMIETDLAKILAERRQKKQSLCLVTGVFDVLHQEHRRFLLAAKELADILVVGLESDERVRQLKGADRPLNSLDLRLTALQSWGIADVVFALPSDFALPAVRQAFINELQPNYLAVSSHSPNLAIKKQMLKSVGGQLRIVHQFQPQCSSSKLIAKRQQNDL